MNIFLTRLEYLKPCMTVNLNRLLPQTVVNSTVWQKTNSRVWSTSVPGAAVAGAQFTEGDQLQVKFILQLSGLLSQVWNTHKQNVHSLEESNHVHLLNLCCMQLNTSSLQQFSGKCCTSLSKICKIFCSLEFVFLCSKIRV